MSYAALKSKAKKVGHPFVGRSVRYKGHYWRVVSAHQSGSDKTPWLTLKRGLGLEAAAKESEVEEVLN